MAHHEFWTDRLSEHLDGSLSDDQAAAVEEHLAECADCRRVASELAEVRRRGRAAGGIAPSRDLWPEIRARLHDDDVVDLTLRLGVSPGEAEVKHTDRRTPRPGRIAAMIALMAATGAAGWAMRGAVAPAGAEAGSAIASTTGEFTGSTPVDFAGADGAPGAAGLAQEAAELERVLAAPPAGVSVETVELLRKNLRVIRAAIADSRAALEMDPENSYVQQHLEGAVARQRDFLRQASSILSAAD